MLTRSRIREISEGLPPSPPFTASTPRIVRQFGYADDDIESVKRAKWRDALYHIYNRKELSNDYIDYIYIIQLCIEFRSKHL